MALAQLSCVDNPIPAIRDRRKGVAGSTGRCNTICGNVDLKGGVYGTNRATRAFC
jgi:hypothetical protein